MIMRRRLKVWNSHDTIEQGVSGNMQKSLTNREQWTPLGYAISKQNLDLVKLVLDRKADIEKPFVSDNVQWIVTNTARLNRA